MLGVTGLSMGAVTEAAPVETTTRLSSTLLMELELSIADAKPGTGCAAVGRGRFQGPRLRGSVCDGGAWIVTRPDGTDEITLRATLRTDDNHTLSIRSRGLIEPARDGSRYTRLTPVLETASARYGWLNRLVTVGVGHRVGGTISCQVFEVG